MLRLAVFATLMAVVASESIFNVTSTKGKSITPGLEIGKFLYTSDTTGMLRTQEDAQEYCRQRGGDLAVIYDQRMYNILRSSISVLGTYWIDGVENGLDLTSYAYEGVGVNTCDAVSLVLNPIATLPQNKRCLSLRLPAATGQQNIEPQLCSFRARVLCATQLENC
ncbi:unnamed protein product [Orchesella dallaii]|uniref:C-type lectin domain-containing protein n=1 Tax=Orchesella dallaii TaxID=48710 RepID=A0ABP1R118_9HEXA